MTSVFRFLNLIIIQCVLIINKSAKTDGLFFQLVERLLAIEKLCMRLRQCVLPEISGLKEAVCEPSLVNEVNNLKIDVSFYNNAISVI